MNAFALLLVTAAVAFGLARYFKLPSVPVLIGAGMTLSLAGLVPDEISFGGGEGAMDMLELGLVFPVPSWPIEFCPHEARLPSAARTTVWEPDALMAVMNLPCRTPSAKTSTGVVLATVVPLPSWPLALLPQAKSFRSAGWSMRSLPSPPK
jgi:hypothetical protein